MLNEQPEGLESILDQMWDFSGALITAPVLL